jgi:hypothetical protein
MLIYYFQYLSNRDTDQEDDAERSREILIQKWKHVARKGRLRSGHSLPETVEKPCVQGFAVGKFSGTQQTTSLLCVEKGTLGKTKTHGKETFAECQEEGALGKQQNTWRSAHFAECRRVTLGKPHFQVMPWTTISCLPSVTC